MYICSKKFDESVLPDEIKSQSFSLKCFNYQFVSKTGRKLQFLNPSVNTKKLDVDDLKMDGSYPQHRAILKNVLLSFTYQQRRYFIKFVTHLYQAPIVLRALPVIISSVSIQSNDHSKPDEYFTPLVLFCHNLVH